VSYISVELYLWCCLGTKKNHILTYQCGVMKKLIARLSYCMK